MAQQNGSMLQTSWQHTRSAQPGDPLSEKQLPADGTPQF